MKRTLTLVFSLACTAALCTALLSACGSNSTEEQQPEESTSSSAVAGGWTINEDETEGYLPSDVQMAFTQTTEELTGVGYTPIACLGSQVVAGTNYRVLCKGTSVTADPVTALYSLTIYVDLDNNAEITDIIEVDLSALENATAATSEDNLTGSWTASDDFGVVNLPADAAEAFDAADDGALASEWVPMALLGTKVVSGCEYAILCHSASGNPLVSVAFVTSDANGNSELLNNAVLDLSTL